MKNIFVRQLVVLFALFVGPSIAALAQNVQFNTLSLSHGLSQATVTCFEQDTKGFIWAGTRDGLNRYDGYNFAVLEYNPRDSMSISNNAITALETDSRGRLWVGTSFGLNEVNTETFQAITYYHWFEDSASISSNKIRCLAEDALGRLWIGTDNGLNRRDLRKRVFERYSIIENDPTSLSNNIVNCILVDSRNRIWIGTDGGLNLFDEAKGSFIRYRQKFDDENSLSNNNVLSLAEDRNGDIWIGTRNGLNKLNPDLGIFSRYFMDEPKQGLLYSNIIKSLVVDNLGDLWVGTPSGLSRFSANIAKNTLYRSGSKESKSLPNDHIISLMIDRSDMIWIGTQSAGIATFDQDAPRFYSAKNAPTEMYEPEQNQVYSFCEVDSVELWIGTGKGFASYTLSSDNPEYFKSLEDHPLAYLDVQVSSILSTDDSVYWVGTDGKGLLAYYAKNDSIVTYMSNPADPASISANRISDIAEDSEGNIYVATLGGGLSILDRYTGKFAVYRFDGNNPNSIRDNNIHALALTGNNTLWLGTGNAGLYKMDISSGRMVNYTAGNPEQGNLPSNSINDLHITKKGKLWIATSGGGISVYDDPSGRFSSYSKRDGLANDVALSLTSDNNGNIWVSTNGGISAFNVSTGTFRNYSEQDVLGTNTFYQRSSYSTASGMIFFGGANGLDYFDSNGLKENTFIPPIEITGIQLIDDEGALSTLELAGNINERLVLEYNHSGFNIDFAALNYKQSQKNRYAFRLKGLFDQWRYIGTRRFATFSNLNPGRYTFEVIGSNNDGIWNEEPATIQIIVKPAYWQTLWFQLLSALAVLGLLYLFYRYQLTSEKARRQKLEEAVMVRTKEISKERDTNAILLKEVHHRVKNNLQIIVSLLNLQSRFIGDSKLLTVFGEIQNRIRSMSMIHQKMYQTKDLKTVNIEEYITDLSESLLRTYRLGHQVELDVDVEVNSFNSDTLTPLGLIINEVISNALKYAFEEDRRGKIIVRLKRVEKNRFNLLIGDDGIGIPPEKAMGKSESFGTELISALTEQLNGSIELVENVQGTVYNINFEDIVE